MTAITQTISALPTAPNRSQNPVVFVANADAFVDAQAGFVAQVNTLTVQINTVSGEVAANSVIAATQAGNASFSAAAAAASAVAAAINAPAWASGTYALGAVAYSPTNFQTYRCKTAGSRTVDPVSDATNWALVINDEVMQNHTVSALKYALTQVGVANKSIAALKNVNQQEGVITFYNCGVINGCALTKNAAGNRSIALALGVSFLGGRKYYTPANASAAIVPDNNGASSAVVYAYLYLLAGIPTLAISAIGAVVPVGAAVLYSLTIPAANTLATDANLAAVTLTDIRRVEPLYPNALDAPILISVSINVVSDIDYQLTFDIVSYIGSPVGERDIKASSRATNGFTAQLISASDGVVVRWKLSKLNN